MRPFMAVIALGLLAIPALATPALAQTAPAQPMPAPAAQEPGAPAPRHGRYLSLHQRFEMANSTHDGRLTAEQAKSASVMRVVARNFDAIDATHKGYVTEDDIRAWYKARRTARHQKAEPDKS